MVVNEEVPLVKPDVVVLEIDHLRNKLIGSSFYICYIILFASSFD